MTQHLLRSLTAVFASALLAGCGRNPEPPAAISTDEITGSAASVFNAADAEIRELMTEAVAAIQQQDLPVAWEKLQILSGRADLSPEQQEFVAQSIAAVGAEMDRAALSGNQAAQQALEFHRANK